MNKMVKLLVSFFFLMVVTVSTSWAENSTGSKMESAELPSSKSYLETMNASIGGSDIAVSVYSNRSVSPLSAGQFGWGGEGLPGSNGWEESLPGYNVGGPIGDLTFPILLSMFFIYFLYRGVSSKKRKSL